MCALWNTCILGNSPLVWRAGSNGEADRYTIAKVNTSTTPHRTSCINIVPPDDTDSVHETWGPSSAAFYNSFVSSAKSCGRIDIAPCRREFASISCTDGNTSATTLSPTTDFCFTLHCCLTGSMRIRRIRTTDDDCLYLRKIEENPVNFVLSIIIQGNVRVLFALLCQTDARYSTRERFLFIIDR